MQSLLTNSERSEIEALSFTLFQRTSVWQRPVKKGVVEPLLDEEGKQVLHKGIKVSRLVFKTEHQMLVQLRDMNTKWLALKKKKAQDAEAARIEKEALEKAASAAGKVGP